MTRPSTKRRSRSIAGRAHPGLARGQTERRSPSEGVRSCSVTLPASGEAQNGPVRATQAYDKASKIEPAGQTGNDKAALYKGARPTVAFTPLPGRGGRLNDAHRVSTALSLRQARKLVEATRFAEAAGLPFNRFTTVHWESAGVADDLAATGRFLKLLGDAVKAGGGRFAYAWVRESGPDKGAHVHILWHGPVVLPVFGRRVRDWLRACGGRPKKGVCHTRSVGRSLVHAVKGGDDYTRNVWEALDYILKGSDPAARAALGIMRHEPGGEIVGLRSSTSNNIGPTARAKGVSAPLRAREG